MKKSNLIEKLDENRTMRHCEAVRPARASARRSSRATKMLREDGGRADNTENDGNDP